MERIPQGRTWSKFCSSALSSILFLSPTVLSQDHLAKNDQSPQETAKPGAKDNPCAPAGPHQIPVLSVQDMTALLKTATPDFVPTLLKRPRNEKTVHEPSNKGIHVGQPKTYDDRSLELMLQSAEQRLRTLQLLDQARIASNVGNIQGGSQSETGFGLQITGSPTPATVANTSSGDTLSSGTTQSSGNSIATNTGSTLTTGTNPPATSLSTTVSNSVTGNGAVSNNSSASNTSSNSLQTSTPSVTPVAPPPVSESGLALSTNGAPSASDILNEEMQLTYEIANLRLLLQGSLNDRFIPGSRILKQHATVGFPISIEPPNDPRYKNAVAEITVIVTTGPVFNSSEPTTTEVDAKEPCSGVLRLTVVAKNSGDCPTYKSGKPDSSKPIVEGKCPDPPGLIAILPREKTYNVTNIQASNVNLAGAVTAKVVTVGATWSHQYKTFYVVQAQDTVAFETEPRLREDLNGLNDFSTAFGWQFRPVLGEKRVRSGLRETFAQLSFQVPEYPAAKLYGYVTVLAKWRSYDPKTGAVGDEIHDRAYEQHLRREYESFEKQPTISSTDNKVPSVQWLGAWKLYQFDLTPELPDVDWEDIGGGKISITANGRYLPGTNVIVGSSSIGSSSTDFLYDPERIRFVASAAQLITSNDVYVEEQGGKVTRLEPQKESNLEIVSVEATPANNTESKVEVIYKGDSFPNDKKKQPLVLIGTTVFGLSDRPIERKCSDTLSCTLSFNAS